MDKYCRLCGEQNENLSHIIFSNGDHDGSETVKTAVIIQKILSIDVRKDDRLPATICYVCGNELTRTAEFIERAHRAQKHLKQLLEISISPKSDHDGDSGSITGASQNLEKNSTLDEPSLHEIDFVSVDHQDQFPVDNNAESEDSRIFTPVSTASESDDSDIDPILEKDDSSASHTSELSNDQCNRKSIAGFLKSLLESESNEPEVTKDERDINSNKSNLTRGNNFDDVQSCAEEETNVTSVIDAEDNTRRLSVRKLNQYYCDLCPVREYFDRYGDFEKHMEVHSKNRPLECEFCDNKFLSRRGLEKHVKATHESRFKCPSCDFICNRKTVLTLHKNSIHKLVGCVWCDFKTKTKRQLNLHVRNKHTEVNPYFVCEICGKTFKTHVALTTHRGYKHFPVPKQCPRCGIMSPHAIAYSRHKLNCVDHRRYYCDFCGSAFFTKYRLREHMNKHLNVRPYECSICAKTFWSRHRLLIHTGVHRGPRFQCDVCGRSFNRKDNMRYHRKTQHASQLAQLEANK